MSKITNPLPNPSLAKLKTAVNTAAPITIIAEVAGKALLNSTVGKAVTSPEFQKDFMNAASTGVGFVPSSIFATGKYVVKHGK